MADYDVIVIGGGAAGLVAAREAARRKARVVIVSDGPLGGDCTFTGCVPSKALLAAAARHDDFTTAMAAVRRAVAHIAATEDAATMAKHGIDVIAGRARFVDPKTIDIDIDGRRLSSPRFVIATGAKPLIPDIPGLRAAEPLTNETLFQLERQPESLVILGGGAIGCEMGQAFARLGTQVTVMEALDRVLAKEEPEASEAIASALRADGVELRTGSPVTSAERLPDGRVRVSATDAAPVVASQLLVAIGRTPSGRGFGLEEIGVALDTSGAVIVNDRMATNVDGIWAAGDVTGRLPFTHAAGRMGWIAASNALWKYARVRGFRFDPLVIPWATFTSPEVGRVGLTEAQAAVAHPDAQVAFLPLSHVDRAIATGAENGFVKLIAAPRRATRHLAGGRLVGATVVAPTGGDLIHEAALAMVANMFVGRLAQTTHAYPTWASAIQQAALQFFGSSSGLTARPVGRSG